MAFQQEELAPVADAQFRHQWLPPALCYPCRKFYRIRVSDWRHCRLACYLLTRCITKLWRTRAIFGKMTNAAEKKTAVIAVRRMLIPYRSASTIPLHQAVRAERHAQS